MNFHASFRTTILAASLALMGTLAQAQVQVVQNGDFGTALGGASDANWVTGGTSIDNPYGDQMMVFDSDLDTLHQDLGTFAAGTSFSLSFFLFDSTYIASSIYTGFDTDRDAAEQVLAKADPILRFGFQTHTGVGWSWASSYAPINGWNASPSQVDAPTDFILGNQTEVRLAFESYSGEVVSGLNDVNGDPFDYDNIRSASIGNVSVFASAAPVPEPESYAMLLAGLGAIGFMSRRRQGKAVASAA